MRLAPVPRGGSTEAGRPRSRRKRKNKDALAGQAGSGITGMQARLRWQGGRLVVIPSPDLMAITPRRGRKVGKLGRRLSTQVAAPARRDRDAIRRRDDHQAPFSVTKQAPPAIANKSDWEDAHKHG